MHNIRSDLHLPGIREIILYGIAIICQLTAITAIFLSIYIEPKGEIHSSILTYFGITCGFCGSILGISTHYSNELTKFKTTIFDSLKEDYEKQENSH
ncbi:MAG: hypothetical protein HDS45_04445 [Bacteroides sp.]|nr:hypothetical protein [Bacteroides sp.]